MKTYTQKTTNITERILKSHFLLGRVLCKIKDVLKMDVGDSCTRMGM